MKSSDFFADLKQNLARACDRETRIRVLKSAGEIARQEIVAQRNELENLLLEHSPFSILASFAFYDLTYLPEIGKRLSETYGVEQANIELVQSLILCHDESEFRFKPFSPPEFQKIRDLAVNISALQTAKDYADVREQMSEEEIDVLMFRSMLRSHTQFVRGWGYEAQEIRVIKELYAPLEEQIEQLLGIRIQLLTDMFSSCLGGIQKRQQEVFTKIKSFMQAKDAETLVENYRNGFNDPQIDLDTVKRWLRESRCNLDQVKAQLLHRSGAFFHGIYAFSMPEFVNAYPDRKGRNAIIQLLPNWAHKLGELKTENKDYFFLNNPIWTKPIMHVAPEVLFWPIPTLFHNFCFEMIDSIVCGNATLKVKYQDRRGKFLEDYVGGLFKERFPDATHFRGSKWRHPISKQEGENDLLVVFDSIALVIEEKSGAINRVAKRGGASIGQEINQLLIEPAQQAHEFVALLRNSPGIHEFETKSGIVNRIDSSKIKGFFCLSITLDRFGPLATQLPHLQKVGLARKGVPLVPTMPLPDLEIALDLLETPFDLLHYLTRRAAFERNRTFIADELDLLVFYLETGFAASVLPEPDRLLALYGLSDQLTAYFMTGSDVKKPRRKMTNWWAKMLKELDRKQVPRRYELGSTLLDVHYESQRKFERNVRKLCNKAKKIENFTLENISGFWIPLTNEISNAVIIGVPIKPAVFSMRSAIVQQMADSAMAKTGARQAVVILLDADFDRWPYVGIYLLNS